MRKIRVTRKAYLRKGYRRRDGTLVKPTLVKGSTYATVDKGKKGRTPKSKYWFKPTVHTNWRKTDKQEERMRNTYRSTPKNITRHDRFILAGKRLQALSNVSADAETKKLARKDALAFFKKARSC